MMANQVPRDGWALKDKNMKIGHISSAIRYTVLSGRTEVVRTASPRVFAIFIFFPSLN
jgi:hypothetical protein